ncbi:MAG TPA: hypothetical protein VF742_06235 [Terracidiphilus sp.]
MQKACGWLSALSIPDKDVESHILRIFALAVSGASDAKVRACGKRMPEFAWQEYGGDPVPVIIAHLALKRASTEHSSLTQLARTYRSILLDSPEVPRLLGRLLSILSETPSSSNARVCLPELGSLVRATRAEIVEICRIALLESAAGTISVASEGSEFLPALALSYARDWDLQTCCALLRTSAYLRVNHLQERHWAVEWLLDQQISDGSFGLLRPEAAYRGAATVDWHDYFDRTIHAVWALSDLRAGSGMALFLGI